MKKRERGEKRIPPQIEIHNGKESKKRASNQNENGIEPQQLFLDQESEAKVAIEIEV